jgi:hypothetical protein
MAKPGPELFEMLNARPRVGNRLPVIYGAAGLSPWEFSSIEEQLAFAEGRYLQPTASPDDLADLSCVLRSGADRR